MNQAGNEFQASAMRTETSSDSNLDIFANKDNLTEQSDSSGQESIECRGESL